MIDQLVGGAQAENMCVHLWGLSATSDPRSTYEGKEFRSTDIYTGTNEKKDMTQNLVSINGFSGPKSPLNQR